MPVKEFFRKMQPVQLYVVLALTIIVFLTELVVSQLTHSLTLLMDSYHMLCNIMALIGCITTIKHDNEFQANPEPEAVKQRGPVEEITLATECQDMKGKKPTQTPRTKEEKKLRNTFGWTRIDVITMLSCCVFLGSFCFSTYVEGLQTLVHIDHQDAIHHPISVLCIGAASLLLNGLCYLLVGGFTFHQGSFLYVTESGDVVLNKVVVNDSVRKGGRRLSRTRRIFSSPPKKRQGLWEMTRDVTGCTLVIVCAIIVIFTEQEVAKFADPILSLVSATTIIVLSYPYMKESCMILLQTMPDTISIDAMKKELVDHFPDIINVHDFHVWQLTASKVISTVHIIFENPKVYRNIMDEIREFFLENGVTQVTIQPEFFSQSVSMESLMSANLPAICLVACQEEQCKINHCCPSNQDLSRIKSSSKEILPQPEPATPTLKSARIIDNELRSLNGSSSTCSLNSVGNAERSKPTSEVGKHVEDNVIKEEKPEAVEASPNNNDEIKENTKEKISLGRDAISEKKLDDGKKKAKSPTKKSNH